MSDILLSLFSFASIFAVVTVIANVAFVLTLHGYLKGLVNHSISFTQSFLGLSLSDSIAFLPYIGIITTDGILNIGRVGLRLCFYAIISGVVTNIFWSFGISSLIEVADIFLVDVIFMLALGAVFVFIRQLYFENVKIPFLSKTGIEIFVGILIWLLVFIVKTDNLTFPFAEIFMMGFSFPTIGTLILLVFVVPIFLFINLGKKIANMRLIEKSLNEIRIIILQDGKTFREIGDLSGEKRIYEIIQFKEISLFLVCTSLDQDDKILITLPKNDIRYLEFVSQPIVN